MVSNNIWTHWPVLKARIIISLEGHNLANFLNASRSVVKDTHSLQLCVSFVAVCVCVRVCVRACVRVLSAMDTYLAFAWRFSYPLMSWRVAERLWCFDGHPLHGSGVPRDRCPVACLRLGCLCSLRARTGLSVFARCPWCHRTDVARVIRYARAVTHRAVASLEFFFYQILCAPSSVSFWQNCVFVCEHICAAVCTFLFLYVKGIFVVHCWNISMDAG